MSEVHDLVQELERTRAKRDFMMGFAQDPQVSLRSCVLAYSQRFLAAWVCSQVKDMSVRRLPLPLTCKATNATASLPEAQRHASFYSKPWVEVIPHLRISH